MGPGKGVLTIRRDEVESLFLAACPSLVASPDRLKYHEDYDGEQKPLLYLLPIGSSGRPFPPNAGVSGHRASSDTIEDHGN